jgi:hypothetical protein
MTTPKKTPLIPKGALLPKGGLRGLWSFIVNIASIIEAINERLEKLEAEKKVK